MNLHPTYPYFPIMIFLSFIASLLPLAWIRRDNIGILFLAAWLATACLNQFVNSIIWYGNTRNPAPVWCDISSRLMIGVSAAIPASALCMVRRLYLICSMKAYLLTPKEKRRALIEDLCICIGIPLLEMTIQYVVEGNRFHIIEDIGCSPATVNVWLAYVLFFSWPVIMGVMNAVYCVLTLRAVIKKGKDINQFFSDNSQRKHYRRLIILSVCELTFAFPFALLVMILNLITVPMVSHFDWVDVHSHYSRIYLFPASSWRSDVLVEANLEMCRWILVLCAIVFYGVFGFSEEAINAYRRAFWRVAGLVGMKPKVPSPSTDTPPK
ncbi:fungal pheromone STE3G-protein-coupled receptor [Rickenella mellea]|uniref:Fungal pheromone STE3G-protein-coupled receptor n=1 Tax=Rickenella mellea TaxID=50990 RepID=A0A4Y7PNT4_9AGAM|nr:fungal pheromone STE3G-protein-coupled receptor [Rickenella mellea]